MVEIVLNLLKKNRVWRFVWKSAKGSECASNNILPKRSWLPLPFRSNIPDPLANWSWRRPTADRWPRCCRASWLSPSPPKHQLRPITNKMIRKLHKKMIKDATTAYQKNHTSHNTLTSIDFMFHITWCPKPRDPQWIITTTWKNRDNKDYRVSIVVHIWKMGLVKDLLPKPTLYLSFSINSHSSGCKLVEDFIDNLDLGIVIASAKGSKLG